MIAALCAHTTPLISLHLSFRRSLHLYLGYLLQHHNKIVPSTARRRKRLGDHPMSKHIFLLLFVLTFPLIILSMVSLHAIVTTPPKTADASGDASTPPLWTILVHGLDSSSHTWENTAPQLVHSPCLAVDQRGCGYSPLGDPADFSQQSLVDDLHHAIGQHCSDGARLVLLGHSLGGRIVLAYAARHAAQVAAVIIEDMDISIRDPTAHGIIQLKQYDGVFERQRATKQDMVQALSDVGYPDSFIDKALATGRIVPPATANGTWWSQVNPDFRKLCYPHILSTDKGHIDCQTLAKTSPYIPCHVLVAGAEGTVCRDDSIQEMQDIMGNQLTVHRFPTAGHSIHSTASEEYLALVNDIIRAAKMSSSL